MAKEVFLLSTVDSLGKEGDVVSVADGYARNYLFPKGLAAEVNEAARRRLVKLQEQRVAKEAAELAQARELAAKVGAASVTIAVKTREDDKLYGSVGAAEIAAALADQGIEIDRHALQLETSLKELGVFDVKIKLHPEVECTVKAWIVDADA
jgi:large subunit ribosomal protein L9